jgi:cyclic pyranopterin phosphate synthase
MSELSHLDESGRARMVDVSAKPDTARVARARGTIRMQRTTLDAIRRNEIGKGDVVAVARLAGIMAAKKTADLIPLCHPISLSHVGVDIAFDDDLPGMRVETEAHCVGKTGVEMEALVAAMMALLTIYDMTKGIDRQMVISDTTLVAKSGGQSGDWHG